MCDLNKLSASSNGISCLNSIKGGLGTGKSNNDTARLVNVKRY